MATKEEVLNAFYQLSPEDREAVAEVINEAIEEQEDEQQAGPRNHASWRTAVGLIKPQGPIPPDEVEQWLPEAMRRKHGE